MHYAMDAMKHTDFRACGGCGAVYHRTATRRGRGRHLGEHPEHDYAPCGCSQTWFGCTPAHVEPDPCTGLEFHAPDDAFAELQPVG
jgi:hypothetical protein